jgi:hypothetical protein
MGNMTIIATAKHSSFPPEMNELAPNAIDVAVAVYKQPNQFTVPKPGKYPRSMLDVIKSAAGDEATIETIAERLGMPRETVVQICKFYLQKLLTAGNRHPLHMLVLDVGATAEDIKDHKRWLLKWLHPDRNPSKWESALFLTIGKAVLQLETGQTSKDAMSPAVGKTNTRRIVQQPDWKYAKGRQRKFGILKLLKPFILAVSVGLIFVFVVTGAISNWSLIRQVIQK